MRTLAMVVVLGTAALVQAPATNYDEAKVPAYTLPPLLVMSDGTPVRGAADIGRACHRACHRARQRPRAAVIFAASKERQRAATCWSGRSRYTVPGRAS